MLICWTAVAALVVPAVFLSLLDLRPAWARWGLAWSLPGAAAVVAVVATVADSRADAVTEDELFAATERASWHMPAYNDAVGLSTMVFAELGNEVEVEAVDAGGATLTQRLEVSADDAVVCVLVEGGEQYATDFRETAVSVSRGNCDTAS